MVRSNFMSVMRLFSGRSQNNSAARLPTEHLARGREVSLIERDEVYLGLLDNSNKWRNHDKMSHIVPAENSSVDYVTGWNYKTNSGNMSSNTTIQPYSELEMTTIHGVMVVLYTATTLLAICGNILAIIIFTKGKRSKTDLRPFLINLAIADLIMAIFCIPFTSTYQLLDSNWVFSRPMCPIVMFLQIVSVTGSVSTNIAIGIDRFCAVVFPLNASRNSRQRYIFTILAIWCIAIATGGVQFYVGDTVYVPELNHIECGENWPSQTLGLIYTILVLVLTYLVPVVVLTATYSIVGYLLWKRNLPGNADAQRDQTQLRAKLKVRTSFTLHTNPIF